MRRAMPAWECSGWEQFADCVGTGTTCESACIANKKRKCGAWRLTPLATGGVTIR